MKSHLSNDLGPDMALYGEKKRQIEEMERLRKHHSSSSRVKSMTEEERLAKVKEM